MTPQILDFLYRTRSEFAATIGSVLEVGSRNVNGTARDAFKDAVNYLGVDVEAGDGVDVVADGEQVATLFPAGHFDAVVCCETLEHCVRPWLVVEALKTALKPAGLLWVTTPTFGFPEHKYPVDCYRFGEDAYRLWLFDEMEILAMETLTDDAGYPCLCAVGRKGGGK